MCILESVVAIDTADIYHEPMVNVDYRYVAANRFVQIQNHAFIYNHTFPHENGKLF